jgi:hypothetical protein
VKGTLGFIAAVGGCAVSAGLVIITATVLGVDALRSNQTSDRTPLFYLLMGGTLTGILVSGGAAWWLLGPIQSTYRRGGLAMVCAFATVLLMLVSIPVYQLLGRSGLLGQLALCAVVSLLLGSRALRRGTVP